MSVEKEAEIVLEGIEAEIVATIVGTDVIVAETAETEVGIITERGMRTTEELRDMMIDHELWISIATFQEVLDDESEAAVEIVDVIGARIVTWRLKTERRIESEYGNAGVSMVLRGHNLCGISSHTPKILAHIGLVSSYVVSLYTMCQLYS